MTVLPKTWLVAIAVFVLNATTGQAAILLRDIGVIGLSSHDMFTWDRVNEVNLENGRLDLSTIFDYDNGSRWERGGNPKNSENAPVYTVTTQLVSFFKEQRARLMSEEGLSAESAQHLARAATVFKFRMMVAESYTRITGLEFPATCVPGAVTNVEQAVLRSMHDILPGTIQLFNRPLWPYSTMSVTNILWAKTMLNEDELNQEIAYFNGDYDAEYLAIVVPFAAPVNLKAVDGVFIERFSPYKQADMLATWGRFGRGEIAIDEVPFAHHLPELYSKAICGN